MNVWDSILKETGWHLVEFKLNGADHINRIKLSKKGKSCEIYIELCFCKKIKKLEDLITIIKENLGTTL